MKIVYFLISSLRLRRGFFPPRFRSLSEHNALTHSQHQPPETPEWQRQQPSPPPQKGPRRRRRSRADTAGCARRGRAPAPPARLPPPQRASPCCPMARRAAPMTTAAESSLAGPATATVLRAPLAAAGGARHGHRPRHRAHARKRREVAVSGPAPVTGGTARPVPVRSSGSPTASPPAPRGAETQPPFLSPARAALRGGSGGHGKRRVSSAPCAPAPSKPPPASAHRFRAGGCSPAS